jgi:hypothetical protein
MGVLGGECAYVKLAYGCYCFRVFGWRREYVMGIICGSVGVSGISGVGGIRGIKECVFIRCGNVGRSVVVDVSTVLLQVWMHSCDVKMFRRG